MDLLITIFRVNFIVDTAEVFALFASILPRYFKGLSCLSQRTDIAQFNVRKLRCKTGMRQHRVDYKTTLFHLMPAGFLDLIGRLFVRPPIEASHQPIILVHTVGTTQHKVRSATQREDLTVPGEEQLGIGLFIWILPTKDFLWAPLS